MYLVQSTGIKHSAKYGTAVCMFFGLLCLVTEYEHYL